MSLSRHFSRALLVTGVMAAPFPAMAGGFYLQEQSPIETGRALSGGAAAGDDPSTIYFNPAAMTQLSGIQTSIGGSALMASAHQTNRGSRRSIPGVPVTTPIAGNDGGCNLSDRTRADQTATDRTAVLVRQQNIVCQRHVRYGTTAEPLFRYKGQTAGPACCRILMADSDAVEQYRTIRDPGIFPRQRRQQFLLTIGLRDRRE